MTYEDSEIQEGTFIRTFDAEADPVDLKWHRDRMNRRISVIENDGWQLQLENQLPTPLTENAVVNAGQWHRLIKGRGRLVVRIVEY